MNVLEGIGLFAIAASALLLLLWLIDPSAVRASAAWSRPRNPTKPAHPLVEVIPAGPDGWTEWQNPIMCGYIMKCCYCGLQHETEFRVGKVDHIDADGQGWAGTLVPEGEYRVQFRMKRRDGR